MEYIFADTNNCAQLSGRLTFKDHPAFRLMATRLLAAEDDTAVIDLEKVDFIDSSGLGMLLIARDEASAARRRLVLRSPQGQVRRMFEISHFEQLFTIQG